MTVIMQHSSLLGHYVSYEENELWIGQLGVIKELLMNDFFKAIFVT